MSKLGGKSVYGGRLATTVSEGAQLGPELITNGDFSVGSLGWDNEVVGEREYENGKVKLTSPDGATSWCITGQSINYTPGATYLIEADFEKVKGDSAFIGAWIGKAETIVHSEAGVSSGRLSAEYTPPPMNATTFEIRPATYTTTTESITLFDNVSVREVLPTFIKD